MNNLSTAGMQDVGASLSVRTPRNSELGGARQVPVAPPRDTKNVSHMARLMAASKGEARVPNMGPERLAALRSGDWQLESLAQAIMDDVGL